MAEARENAALTNKWNAGFVNPSATHAYGGRDLLPFKSAVVAKAMSDIDGKLEQILIGLAISDLSLGLARAYDARM